MSLPILDMKAALLIIGLIVCLPVHAEIYKYVDESGQVTYTNLPKRGAKRLNLGPVATPAAPARKKEVGAPANFPRVDGSTQRKRDDLRRSVLQDELRTEERNLAEATAAQKAGEVLRSGEQPGSASWRARNDKLRDIVKLHEDNIRALKKELASIK
ncbi:hypothetical protein TPL01_00350 [Sulfuriferula plumbiphila]|uniref:DUF4124 domain-containing protein n=2 Tax=Sulfuriferula plumbiphila TaxID=171865 RepID=A0A512L349_9PROT|nr:hypothetical protein SFPGR_00250 [Sulfuriferula plumbiphila]GEP28897.1 hypothetical protein TPL01_00350 [Sulfuriferula plumbiphila]